MSPSGLFLERSVHHLQAEFLPRIRAALDVLGPDDLWWRAHAGSNSVGNLLLHLEGNVRQWILSGLGGQPDHRQRDTEFQEASVGVEDLWRRLRHTVDEACAVIATLPESRLTDAQSIQGFQTTGLAAIYHVVEHFSWHTGQIAYVSKLRGGPAHGLSYYDDASLRTTNPPADPAD